MATALYGLLSVAAAFGIWRNYEEFRRYPVKPLLTTLLDATTDFKDDDVAWVTLTGLEWKCQDVLKDDINRLIPLRDPVTGGLVVFKVGETFGCDAAKGNVTGVLSRVAETYHQHLSKKGWAILGEFPKDNLWSLCEGCSPDDTKIGFYFLGPLQLILLAAFFLFFRKWRAAARS